MVRCSWSSILLLGVLVVPALGGVHLVKKASPSLDPSEILQELTKYNVSWDSPSKDATGSMPIGNGVVGANVWVDPDGVLHFYIARSDCWSEVCRLLKVGEVTVKITPNPFKNSFHQELQLANGRIHFAGEGFKMDLFVDSNHPTIYVSGVSEKPVKLSAQLFSWRTAQHVISGEEANSAWTMMGGPLKLVESADHVSKTSNAVTIYHRNDTSCVDFTLNWQGLKSFDNLVGDPILHRTFGATIEGNGLVSAPLEAGGVGGTLESPQQVRSFSLHVTSDCGVTSSAGAFLKRISSLQRDKVSLKVAKARTEKYWNAFWARSYVYVSAPAGSTSKAKADCFHITQSYALQRFMMACASRGAFPLKFNGSLFTVEPAWFGKDFNPDWRRWGDGYWWQNTRLPYWAMVASGDFQEMEPLFNMYQSILPICESRSKFYYKAKGAYFPETISFFGTYSNNDYGWNRKPNQAPQDFDAEWWKYAYNQGPELVQMMLDRYNAKPNPAFLRKQLIPMARQVVLFFETRFPRDSQGKLKITPDQVIETYRNGVINDTPCIAGLHSILPSLLKLPGISSADRKSWSDFYSILPPVSIADGKIRPAQEFSPERFNVENAEFYAIWPFRVYGIAEGNGTIAADTFDARQEKANTGWQYDGQTAALSGLTEDAKSSLLVKVANSNKHFRFPAMWGPNYDWLPDQTHGGNIMLTLQSMLVQTGSHSGKVLVCPAWPKDWNVNFKLFSTAGKVIVGSSVDGVVAYH